jgi:anti-sigma regulatory factor (Ser/Thr protein kinase)
MSEPLWGRRGSPRFDAEPSETWTGEPTSPAELTAMRLRLRAALGDDSSAVRADEDDVERLLLAVEELTSNGLRHGAPPVCVRVLTTAGGWLVDVSDTACDDPPVPAVGRDAAAGGLGLYLVAGLAVEHGWLVLGDRKHVWAHIGYASGSPAGLPGTD